MDVAQRASVINFKGGVGKTTLAVHLGCYLASFRTPAPKVLMVDVDHQSSLSIVVMDVARWEPIAKSGLTVNRIFTSYTIPGAQVPGKEIIATNPFGDSYPTLDLVPSQLELDDTEVELAATNVGNPLLSEWRKRTLLARWLEESGVDEEYDFILFDCPPATKIVSQNAVAASHAYIVPVVPDAPSTRGVTHFKNLVEKRIDARLKVYAASIPANEIPSTYEPDTDLGGIVISNAQTHGPSASGYINEHTTHMHALRKQWKGAVLDHVLDRAAGVPESLGTGWPVYDCLDNGNVTGRQLPAMFRRVCKELVGKLGW